MAILQKVALALTIIGSLNWGLIGIFNFNLVDFIFMHNSILTRTIYILVGICAVINIGIYFMKFRNNNTISYED